MSDHSNYLQHGNCEVYTNSLNQVVFVYDDGYYEVYSNDLQQYLGCGWYEDDEEEYEDDEEEYDEEQY